MAEEDEQRCFEDTMKRGRSHKLTEKGLEERLQRCIAMRRRTLGILTSKKKELESMMSDAQNLQRVKYMMENDFATSLDEFNRLHNEVANLLIEDEKTADQEIWFEPKMAVIRGFMKTTKNWIAAEHEPVLPVEKELQKENVVDFLQETVKPSDSVSQVGATRASTRGSQISRTSAAS